MSPAMLNITVLTLDREFQKPEEHHLEARAAAMAKKESRAGRKASRWGVLPRESGASARPRGEGLRTTTLKMRVLRMMRKRGAVLLMSPRQAVDGRLQQLRTPRGPRNSRGIRITWQTT